MQAAKSCSSTHQKAIPNLKPTPKKQRKLFKDKDKNIKRSTPYSIKAHHSIKTSHNIKRSHREHCNHKEIISFRLIAFIFML